VWIFSDYRTIAITCTRLIIPLGFMIVLVDEGPHDIRDEVFGSIPPANNSHIPYCLLNMHMVQTRGPNSHVGGKCWTIA
jgi:hypothetical protein